MQTHSNPKKNFLKVKIKFLIFIKKKPLEMIKKIEFLVRSSWSNKNKKILFVFWSKRVYQYNLKTESSFLLFPHIFYFNTYSTRGSIKAPSKLLWVFNNLFSQMNYILLSVNFNNLVYARTRWEENNLFAKTSSTSKRSAWWCETTN